MIIHMATSKVLLRLRRLEQPLDAVFDAPQLAIDDQYLAPVEMNALPRFIQQELTVARLSGDSPKTKAHLAVTESELRRLRILPNALGTARLKHARIVGIRRMGAFDETDYIITDVEAGGHLMGGPNFLKLVLGRFGDHVGGIGGE